jgi:hypothetical protein
MKTTRVIAIALIVCFATLGYAQSETAAEKAEPTPTHALIMPLQKALHVPALLRAMRAQLTPDFLKNEQPLYTQPVRYNRGVTYVAGTYGEWSRFFGVSQTIDPQIDVGILALAKAIKNGNLVRAMKNQLNITMLRPAKEYYTFPVRYKHSVIYVGGTKAEWKKFFSAIPRPISVKG